MELDSAFEYNTISSIKSNMSSDNGIKCQSFHTNDSYRHVNELTFLGVGGPEHPNNTRSSIQKCFDEVKCPANNSFLSSSKSSTSSEMDSSKFNKKLKQDIENDIKDFRNQRI